ncbi:MAG: glutathione S-transferase family protein [Alphaproteobacteria bacterium]
MAEVTLYGMEFSVYVRIVRLTLAEKGVDYTLEAVDVFEPGLPEYYENLHPFKQMPAFRHGDVVLYEARAITQYIDEVFDGPALQPQDPLRRARQSQIISVADNHLYRALVWGLFVEIVSKPQEGETTDNAVVTAALKKAKIALPAVARLFGESPFATGDSIGLADLHLAPMFDYFLRCPAAPDLMREQQRLTEWWTAMKQRKSVVATPFGRTDDSKLPPLKL